MEFPADRVPVKQRPSVVGAPPGLAPPLPPGTSLEKKGSFNVEVPPSLVHKLSAQTISEDVDILDALERANDSTTPPSAGLLPKKLSNLGQLPPGLSDNKAAPPPPGLGLGPPVEYATPAQKEEFRKFMAWKNPTFPPEHTELILNMFKIEDVADAVRDKFGILPQGWRQLVKSDMIARDLPTGLSRGMSIKPGELEKKLQKEEFMSMSDLKINEILDSEQRFVTQITELQEKYLDRLYQIWDGSKANKEASKALGLTQDEANQIFEQLGQIVRFSQNLLSKLDIINLVRKQPATGEGRAIHVGRAFIAMAPKLHVYAPAITSYQSSLQILNSAIERLPKKGGALLNFMEWWEKVSATNDALRGQQLQAVLITPMQRVPRYKMLLEQLLKDCDNPAAIPVVEEALNLFASAATNINDALRKHEKLQNMFGDPSLKPLSSTGTVKDGVVKVTNTYQAKNL